MTIRESAVMRGTVLRVEREARPGDPLTNRQRGIVLAAADGLTYKEIAARNGISERTVKAHANVIFVKLDAVSMTNAVAIFLRTVEEPVEGRSRLRELVCIVAGHRVKYGPCWYCGRRAKG